MSLSHKRNISGTNIPYYNYPEEELKKAIKLTMEKIKSLGCIREDEYLERIDKIFEEEFGKLLIQNDIDAEESVTEDKNGN